MLNTETPQEWAEPVTPKNTEVTGIMAIESTRRGFMTGVAKTIGALALTTTAISSFVPQETAQAAATEDTEKKEPLSDLEQIAYDQFDEYIKNHPEHKAYKDEAVNLLGYFNEKETLNSERSNKLISFMISEREKSHAAMDTRNDSDATKRRYRPFSYQGAARTKINLLCDKAGSTDLGWNLEKDEYLNIINTLDSKTSADDFFGALSSGDFYAKYGDNSYLYFNPDTIIRPKNSRYLTTEEKRVYAILEKLNGLDSDYVTIMDNTKPEFNASRIPEGWDKEGFNPKAVWDWRIFNPERK